MTPFGLLKEKRFGPFFWTQFWGAFNDNLFKNALVILIAYRAANESEGGLWINIAAGLFILPFFLFSPLAGQISDKFEKSKLIRLIKISEIIIMSLGALAFFSESREFLISILFLMGAQSAFFGPIKYSILPQVLKTEELVAGNAMVELGTFVAILTGTLLGGLLVGVNTFTVAIGVIVFAILGYISSRRIPLAPSSASDLKISYNFFKEIAELYHISKKERSVHLSVLGISWFWFYGAVFLSQLPNYTKYFVSGDETVGTFFLAIFSISIGVGSLICERLSKDDIELGLVPLGAFGMSLFALDLYFINYPPTSEHLFSAAEFLYTQTTWTSYRIILDLMLIGIFGSFYTLPLYALIQKRTHSSERSRLIAWLNMVNSLFMVVSAVCGIGLYRLGFNTVGIFGVTAVLNFIVGTYIFLLIPEFLFRFIVWVLAHTIYRIKIIGKENIPQSGAAIIVSNHVSFIDWFIVTAACRRPVRFVMDHNYFFIPVVRWFFQLSKTIPIAPKKESEKIKERAFELISHELRDGQLVCIFPEGMITHDGKLNTFRPGVERILAQDRVPVIPISIQGLWGSFFSRSKGRAMKGLPELTRRSVVIIIGAQHPPSTSAQLLEHDVLRLLRQTQVQ